MPIWTSTYQTRTVHAMKALTTRAVGDKSSIRPY